MFRRRTTTAAPRHVIRVEAIGATLRYGTTDQLTRSAKRNTGGDENKGGGVGAMSAPPGTPRAKRRRNDQDGCDTTR